MTQVIAPFASKAFRQSRVLEDPHKLGRKAVRDLTRDEKKLARHMAHDGASTAQIQQTLGFESCHRLTFTKKLSDLNIRPFGNRKAHRGQPVTMPGDVDQRTFRPVMRGTP